MVLIRTDREEWENWAVYIVLCRDGSLYCGISTDVEARVEKHNQGKGAKYTAGRRPVFLVWWSEHFTHSNALKLERKIKSMKRSEKWRLVKENYDVKTLI
jgi:putative endonuclease